MRLYRSRAGPLSTNGICRDAPSISSRHACRSTTGLGRPRPAVKQDLFVPSALVQTDLGKPGHMLGVEKQQTPLTRRAAIADDVLVLSDTRRLEGRLCLVERFELVGVVLLHQPSPVEADDTRDVALPQPHIIFAPELIQRTGIDVRALNSLSSDA